MSDRLFCTICWVAVIVAFGVSLWIVVSRGSVLPGGV
jgi:hypothetical protein